jgi:hypothetical protein
MPRPTSKAAWFSLAEIYYQPFLLISDIVFCDGQPQKLRSLAWQRFAASLSYWSPQGKDSATANLNNCMVQLGRVLPPNFHVGLGSCLQPIHPNRLNLGCFTQILTDGSSVHGADTPIKRVMIRSVEDLQAVILYRKARHFALNGQNVEDFL